MGILQAETHWRAPCTRYIFHVVTCHSAVVVNVDSLLVCEEGKYLLQTKMSLFGTGFLEEMSRIQGNHCRWKLLWWWGMSRLFNSYCCLRRLQSTYTLCSLIYVTVMNSLLFPHWYLISGFFYLLVIPDWGTGYRWLSLLSRSIRLWLANFYLW